MNLVCSTLYGLCPHPQHCTTLVVSSTLYILYIFDTVWILNPVLAWYPKHCMNMMIASPTLYKLDCILNIVQNLHPQYCLDPQHCMDPISQTLYEQDCILNTVWTWLCLKHCVEFAPNTVYTVYFRYSTDSGCILNTTRTLNPQHLIVHIHNTVRTLFVNSVSYRPRILDTVWTFDCILNAVRTQTRYFSQRQSDFNVQGVFSRHRP